MEITIEEPVPYERSILWRLHDAYFATRGEAAWTGREIPSFATGNYAFARQHARFVVAAVAALEGSGALGPADEVRILEVGCGLGDFAASFFRALEDGTGAAGRALLPRVRYVLSDYSAKTVRDALARTAVARLAAAGSVVGATFDVGRPSELRDLEGREIGGKLAFVVANYVCCVSRVRLVRRTRAGWDEGRVGVKATVPDFLASFPADQVRASLLADPLRAGLLAKDLAAEGTWASVDLAALVRDPLHEATIRDLLEPRETATVVYPQAFLDLLLALRARLLPGGLALVSDFGSGSPDVFASEHAASPVHYGNTLNHGVAFAIFDAFCARAGLGLRRTKDPFSSLFTAAISAGEIPAAMARAFRRIYCRESEGQELTELRTAASALLEAKDPRGAARLLARCLELDPGSAELHHRLGAICLESGWDRLALRYLKRGEALDERREHDFAFKIGRLHMRRGAHEAARRAFTRAVKSEKTALNYLSLGMALEKLERYREAYGAFRKSLALDSKSETARTLMLRIIDQYLPKAWAADVAKEAE